MTPKLYKLIAFIIALIPLSFAVHLIGFKSSLAVMLLISGHEISKITKED